MDSTSVTVTVGVAGIVAVEVTDTPASIILVRVPEVKKVLVTLTLTVPDSVAVT